MATELLRDTTFGQLVRYATGNRVFLYPEEQPGFQCPPDYAEGAEEKGTGLTKHKSRKSEKDELSRGPKDIEEGVQQPEAEINEAEDEDDEDSSSADDDAEEEKEAQRTSNLQRTESLPYSPERLEIDRIATLDRTKSIAIRPTRTEDGTILVDWYATDDPANPQNWTQGKKFKTAFLIDLYTFVVYSSSSIYVSSQLLVEERFGVGHFKGALGLALYVLGYGIGPLIWSPMSEMPRFGRNIPYVSTFAVFTILALPTALADNLGGLLTLRFLLGFFGSPCLANGGASMQDMYSLLYLPYSVAMWVSAAFAGPALGPLLSGFAVYAENWRWSQWEVLWMAGPVFLLFFFFLQETQPSTILLQRAQRLRKITGNTKLMSQSEIDQRNFKFSAQVLDAMIKPIEISLKDPAILFVNVYTALTYGIYYSFFEVFPLVFGPIYHFNVGLTSTVFVCLIVGCFIAMAIYFVYLSWYLIPDILKNGLREQEHRLQPALIACIGPTVGLFLFGWTARESIHWIVPVIGITLYSISVYIVMQCIFVYVPMSYPQYAASLFAGNDLFRSLFAFGAVLFSRPMYLQLGIGKGVSLLGGLSIMGIIGIWLLYFYGKGMRARSKFAIG